MKIQNQKHFIFAITETQNLQEGTTTDMHKLQWRRRHGPSPDSKTIDLEDPAQLRFIKMGFMHQVNGVLRRNHSVENSNTML